MPGFKTFGVGDVLTAAEVNGFLMTQVIVQCTSGTRPTSPVEGQTIYETDTDRMLTYIPGPGWQQSAGLGKSTSTALTAAAGFSVNSSRSMKTAAGVVAWQGYLACTTTITPTAGGNITPDVDCCTLPAGYWPPDIVCISWDNGATGGQGVVNPDGTVQLRTSLTAISAGTNLRLAGSWIQ